MSELPNEIKDIIRRELRMELPVFLEGWTTAERGIEMAQLVMDVKPLLCLELGVFGGRSLLAQALALKHIKGGWIVGVDSWRKHDVLDCEKDPGNIDWWSKLDIEKIHQGCMQAIWRLGIEDRTLILRSASQHCHALFRNESVDILNIDSNHSEEASCRDVTLYLPTVRKGGFVWLDDADWKTTKKAQVLLELSCDTIRTSPDGHYKLYQKR